jgi:hypothetical protein
LHQHLDVSLRQEFCGWRGIRWRSRSATARASAASGKVNTQCDRKACAKRKAKRGACQTRRTIPKDRASDLNHTSDLFVSYRHTLLNDSANQLFNHD